MIDGHACTGALEWHGCDHLNQACNGGLEDDTCLAVQPIDSDCKSRYQFNAGKHRTALAMPPTVDRLAFSVQEKAFSVAMPAFNLQKQAREPARIGSTTCQQADSWERPISASCVSDFPRSPGSQGRHHRPRGVGLAWACGGMLSCTGWLQRGSEKPYRATARQVGQNQGVLDWRGDPD